MSRQISFFMNKNDEQLFLNLLEEKNEINIIPCSYAAPQIEFLDELSNDDNWKSFIWNKNFPFEPHYSKSGFGRFSLDASSIPVIEFVSSSQVGSDMCTAGRLYWNSDLAEYDKTEFSKWYECCVRIIKSNSAHREKGVYYFPGAWKELSDLRERKETVWLSCPEHNDKIFFNLNFDCQNDCTGCKRSLCMDYCEENLSELKQKIFSDLDKIEAEACKNVIFGAYSEPLVFDHKFLEEIFRHIKLTKMSEISLITNGLSYINETDTLNKLTDNIYIFIPGSSCKEYFDITFSKYGESAFEMAIKFADECKSMYKNVYVRHNASRNEILNICISE